jgi:hypothetical protein
VKPVEEVSIVVLFELVKGALEAVAGFVGIEVSTTILLALAAILVGAYYAREVAGFLVSAARIIQIGGTVAALLLVLLVAGVGLGALTLDGGTVADVLRQLGSAVRSLHV